MIKIKISDELISYCKKQIKLYNFGQRGIADGNKEEQFVGCIGESIVRELFSKERLNGEKGFDGGYDIVYKGVKIDVKTMGRTTDIRDYYVHNFIALQKDYNVDIYIFTSYNKIKKELTICGWITKEDFFKKAKFYKKGTKRYRSNGSYFETKADLYEIKNNELNYVIDFDELRFEILKIKDKK
jgi:hypothetical protein